MSQSLSIESDKPSIIIFIPVRLNHLILRESLHELCKLKTKKFNIEYWFYDDNDDQESKELLQNFKRFVSSPVRILPELNLIPVNFTCTEDTHRWKLETINRVINIKNNALQEFIKTKAEAIFLIDSDLCLHPETLNHLHSLNLPIVSEVFWTKWNNDSIYLPNVWDADVYSYHSLDSLSQLRNPGQYRVGGLGACTLVKRSVIESGVTFSLIDNVSFWGEDRHFCIRARCNNFELVADTCYPPFHIYRETLLSEVQTWKDGGRKRKYFTDRLDKEWEANVRKWLAGGK
jgi:hypothetical protein